MLIFKHNFFFILSYFKTINNKRVYGFLHNSIYFYLVIASITVFYNKESVRNFSDFSVAVGVFFFIALFSIFYDLLYCGKNGKFSSKDFTLNYVTWNYIFNLLMYSLIVVFGFTFHSLNKLENDLFESFNYHFFYIFSYLYQEVLFISILFLVITSLHYLKTFFKYNYASSKIALSLLYFLLITLLVWLSLLSVFLLFKQYTNVTRFVNFGNINKNCLASPNDSILRNNLYNDTRNSEWLTYVWEHTVNINNQGNYTFLFLLFIQLVLTGLYLFITFITTTLNDVRIKLNNVLTFFIYIFENLFVISMVYNLNLIAFTNILQI